MSASLKLLLRLFLLFGGPFGGLVGLLAGVAVALNGGTIGFALFVGAAFAAEVGVIFGAALALILGGWQILAVRRLGYRLTDETLSVRQRRRLTLGLPLSEAFTLCLASVRNLGRTDVEEETDFTKGVILATKRWQWRGSGERLRFDLRGRGEQTEVEIESRPLVRTTVVDCGGGLQNVDGIVGFLLAHGDVEGVFAAKRSEQVRASPDRVRQSEDGVSPTS
jgi:hypothetical protein